jgi:hypothetical protein
MQQLNRSAPKPAIPQVIDKVGVPALTQFAPLLPENYSQLNRLQAFIERFTRPA